MDENQVQEVFQGMVNKKYDTVLGKIVEEDGKYMFEGVALNKTGKIVGSITYVTGCCALVYLGAKAGAKIGEKIADKIHQRRIRKAKAEAFDEVMDIIEKEKEKLIENASKEGKHFKDEESE